MTRYERSYPFPHVLGPHRPERILGEICAENGLTNLRTAETEKYPHVTYFFNGGRKSFRRRAARDGCFTQSRHLRLAAGDECCRRLRRRGEARLRARRSTSSSSISPTATWSAIPATSTAAVKAIETVDDCLGRIYEPLKRKGGAWIVTADHGNADLLVDPETGDPHTYHTTFPVPLIVVGEFQGKLRDGGSLRAIAPTILGLLGIEPPEEMTGRDLRAAH